MISTSFPQPLPSAVGRREEKITPLPLAGGRGWGEGGMDMNREYQ